MDTDRQSSEARHGWYVSISSSELTVLESIFEVGWNLRLGNQEKILESLADSEELQGPWRSIGISMVLKRLWRFRRISRLLRGSLSSSCLEEAAGFEVGILEDLVELNRSTSCGINLRIL